LRRFSPAAGILIAALSTSACLAFGYRTKPRIAIVGGDPVVQMAPPGKLRSAVDPRKVLAAHHRDAPAGKERLVGVEVQGQAFAYPIGLLDRVEVINDGNGSVNWVVARCALTHVAAVYDRSLEGRLLTFENSGALWRDTLVLKDRETGTYWTAATGAALTGPLAGRELAPLPAVYTTVESWRRAHPSSRYADLGLPTSVPFLMRIYGASPWQGVSGQKTRNRLHPPKGEFLSVAAGRETVAFKPGEIRERRSVVVELGGETLAIEWDARVEAPRAWRSAGEARSELAVVPMYWFALDRHFDTVRGLTAP
jgi:hypothetical protein